ncbi:hypothetical protein HRbin20_01618 [bacterium HR20]|nr:hypothetical protein HRbin20_01618 [bacterium HR20]GIV55528.1 MAG: hypothetical protein KatS3mg040_0296 [Candidatus Kapabacteria bacterium]
MQHARWLILLLAYWGALHISSGCRSAQPIPSDAVLLTGRINPMLGPRGTVLCWVLEVGSDLRSLKYYALVGSEEMMAQLRREDATVTLRAVIRSDLHTDCPVGSVAEVYEILELRTPSD